MKKKIYRLTESDLHQIITKTVNNIMENHFDDFIANELKLPQEARFSRMSDEDIIGMLNQHKKEQMDYDEDQLRHQREREMNMFNQDDDLENTNIYDDEDDEFKGSNEYLNYGDKYVPNL